MPSRGVVGTTGNHVFEAVASRWTRQLQSDLANLEPYAPPRGQPKQHEDAGLRSFRDSGTEIGLGYATGREPTVWMTNGSSTAAVKSIAEVRSRYLDSWDFGTAAHPGVRIYVPISQTEKILQAAEICVRLKDTAGPKNPPNG